MRFKPHDKRKLSTRLSNSTVQGDRYSFLRKCLSSTFCEIRLNADNTEDNEGRIFIDSISMLFNMPIEYSASGVGRDF